MPWIGSTTTVFLRGLGKPSIIKPCPLNSRFTNKPTSFSLAHTHGPAPQLPGHVFQRRTFLSAAMPVNYHPPDTGPLESQKTTQALRSAELSRASAQAVRRAISQGQTRDAFLVMRSLSASCDPKRDSSLPILIPYPQPVSPRLAGHALVHSLLREGLTKKASNALEQLMKGGMHMHPATLEAVVKQLCVQSSKMPPTTPPHYVKKKFNAGRVLEVAEPHLRLALIVMHHARAFRQQRTALMFLSVLKACLMHGEIMVACFLFCLLIKDWETRVAVDESRKRTASQNTGNTAARRLERRVRPDSRFLSPMLLSIRRTIDDPNADLTARHNALQALVYLAALLDERRLPFSRVSGLIEALYSVPHTCTDRVWIPAHLLNDGQRFCKLRAYQYCHTVLARLVKNPPDDDRMRLDVRSYNALLNYALRHRLSPEMANTILVHFAKGDRVHPDIVTYNIILRAGTLLRKNRISDEIIRALRLRDTKGALQLDIKSTGSPQPWTVNPGHDSIADCEDQDPEISQPFALDSLEPEAAIVPPEVIRTGTLLESSGSAQDNREPQSTNVDLQSPTQSAYPDPQFQDRDCMVLFKNVDMEGMVDEHGIRPDRVTLTSFIVHLTSTGRPHLIAEVLFHVLPELRAVDHPTTPRRLLSPANRDMSRKACIERAAFYGPYFFSTVINALAKAGKTGLAERVWLLARQAERASALPHFFPPDMREDIKPWRLPVEAYTSMLQCYTREARVGRLLASPNRSRAKVRDAWRNLLAETANPLADDKQWKMRPGKLLARGWAYFVRHESMEERLKAVERHGSERRKFALKLGFELYKEMRAAVYDLYESLPEAGAGHATTGSRPPQILTRGRLPLPDARLYNAMLELFGPNRGVRRRGGRVGRHIWARRLLVIERRWAEASVKPKYHPALKHIVKNMVEDGFKIPAAYRGIAIVSDDASGWTNEGRRVSKREIGVKPFAFPLPKPWSFHPYLLPTWKTRGLPVPQARRSWAARSGRRREHG